MRNFLITCGIILLLLIGWQAVNYCFQCRGLKQQKERVCCLISVGQDIDQAQKILQDEDFRLSYPNPISPTRQGQYFEQIVPLRDSIPTIDTFFYLFTGGKNPLAQESPYVIIRSDATGKIIYIK